MARFTRVGSPGVLFQAHVTEDSRYVILPVIEEASKILGWVVYDSLTGQIVNHNPQPLNTARDWTNNLHKEKE